MANKDREGPTQLRLAPELKDEPALREKIQGKSDLQVVQVLLEELADESHELKLYRDKVKEMVGDEVPDQSMVSSRRVTALKEMAGLLLERTKLSKKVDLEHPVIKETMNYVFGKLEATLLSNSLPRPQVDVIMSSLAHSLKDWKVAVERRLSDVALDLNQAA